MLAELFSWWTEQMRELVLPMTRRRAGRSTDALVLACAPDQGGPWRILRRRNGEITPLATLSVNDTDTAWREAMASWPQGRPQGQGRLQGRPQGQSPGRSHGSLPGRRHGWPPSGVPGGAPGGAPRGVLWGVLPGVASGRQRGVPVVIALRRPFLVRRTTLPIAASANLERLLRYEMDRLTPFAPDDVLFSHRILARDVAAGTLLVELAVVPKSWVREPLERLAALAIRPEAVEEQPDPNEPELLSIGEFPAGGLAGVPDGTDLARSDQPVRRIALEHADPARRARVRLAWRGGAVACATLAAAVLLLPFIRQSLALSAVEDQIGRLRPPMEQVDALRRQIAAGSAGVGQIAAARQSQTTALRVLGVLTDLLPDDTFLTSISLRHARLIIEGHSTAATRLIATMAADPQLTNPSFGAPVVRAENGTDVFTIQAGFGS